MLASLRVTGPVRPSFLARRTGLEAPLVSRELRALVLDGYVRRAADPTDGRAGIVDLTAKGRRAADAYRAATDDLAAEAFEDWTAADLRTLAGLLERVAVDISRPRDQPLSSDGRL
jgi:DNA-binding MarR family transcriptional regulator